MEEDSVMAEQRAFGTTDKSPAEAGTQVRDKAQEAGAQVRDRAQEAGAQVRDRVQEAGTQVRDRAQEAGAKSASAPRRWCVKERMPPRTITSRDASRRKPWRTPLRMPCGPNRCSLY